MSKKPPIVDAGFSLSSVPVNLNRPSIFMSNKATADIRKHNQKSIAVDFLKEEFALLKMSATRLNLSMVEYIRRLVVSSALELIPYDELPYEFKRGSNSFDPSKPRTISRCDSRKRESNKRPRDPRTGRFRKNNDPKATTRELVKRIWDEDSGSSSDGEGR